MINLHNLYIYTVYPFFERDYFNFDDSRIISAYNYDVKISFNISKPRFTKGKI